MSSDGDDSWDDISKNCWKALQPSPNGSPPNFNAPTFQPIAIGVVTTLTIIAVLVVSMRVTGALRKDSRLHFEDYSCILALIFTIANSVIDVLEDNTTRHAWDVSQCVVLDLSAAKKNAALMLLYPSGLVFAKAAICVLYMRLFGCVKHVHYTAIGILIFNIFTYIVAMVLGIVYVFPWKKEWQWGRDRPDTWSMRHYIVIFGFVTVITDVILLALPIRSIVKLNTSVRKRIGLIVIFTAGFGAAIAAGVNLYFRVDFYYFNVYDYTWSSAWLGLTADIELYITIILGCIPGCVAAWRNKIRDSAAMRSIRSRIRGSKAFSTSGMSPLDTIYEVNPKFGKAARSTNYGDTRLTEGGGNELSTTITSGNHSSTAANQSSSSRGWVGGARAEGRRDDAFTPGNGLSASGLSVSDDIERQHHNALALEGVVIAQRKMEERIRSERKRESRLFTFLSDGRESR